MKKLLIASFCILCHNTVHATDLQRLRDAKPKGKVKTITCYQVPLRDSADWHRYPRWTDYYDATGNKIAGKTHTVYGLMDSAYYEYDKAGNRAREVSRTWETKYSYGNNGRVSEMNRLSRNGLTERKVFAYDSKGGLEKISAYNGDGNLAHETKIMTGANGEIVETTFDGRGALEHKETTNIRPDGNVSNTSEYSEYAGGAKRYYHSQRHEYTRFDGRGNWTMRITTDSFEGQASEELVVREIEYYP